jgi:hypothetical protein
LAFLDKDTVDAITGLASAVGVPGAALLILAIGLAVKGDKIAETIRGTIRDYHDHSRKSRELDHRIKRDSDAIGLEIADRKSVV